MVSPLTPADGVLLKRDDLLHPDIPGNKWRKLKYNITGEPLVTFGGAYSNHIRAVAAAGRAMGFATGGVIRGEPVRNEVLDFAVACGMRLVFVTRALYREKGSAEMLGLLDAEFPGHRVLPEGGSNAAAVRGCMEIGPELAHLGEAVVCCPVGTGGTLAGLAAGLPPGFTAVGFSVLKGGGFLNDEVARLQTEALGHVTTNWRIETGFHFGGYARTTPELSAFIRDFETRHGLRLDPVYTAKMMYGIRSLGLGPTVVALVTGKV